MTYPTLMKKNITDSNICVFECIYLLMYIHIMILVQAYIKSCLFFVEDHHTCLFPWLRQKNSFSIVRDPKWCFCWVTFGCSRSLMVIATTWGSQYQVFGFEAGDKQPIYNLYTVLWGFLVFPKDPIVNPSRIAPNTPLKTNMASWKIPILCRKFSFIHGPFPIQLR